MTDNGIPRGERDGERCGAVRGEMQTVLCQLALSCVYLHSAHFGGSSRLFAFLPPASTKYKCKETDGRTDGWMDRRTDGR